MNYFGFLTGIIIGNFLVSKESPHRPILLDFGLTKKLSSTITQALAKMFLASAEVGAGFCVFRDYMDTKPMIYIVNVVVIIVIFRN